MLLTFFLLFIGLHVSEGCTLAEIPPFTAHEGESVLLPCYCTDQHNTPETFTWKKYDERSGLFEEISSESGQYRNRIQLFNDHSPANLSLLISHLTEEDGGFYRCEVKDSGSTEIALTVKVCTLVNSGQQLSIRAHAGESVLLPCYCTDLHTKPETFTWKKFYTNRDTYEEISSESDQYRNRVQLFNNHSPANLSLLISHLTEEDGGDYRCQLTADKQIDFRLIVEATIIKASPSTESSTTTTPSTAATSFIQTPNSSPQSLPFVPFALVTVIFLHIIVAVVYYTKRTRAQSDSADGDEVVSLE